MPQQARIERYSDAPVSLGLVIDTSGSSRNNGNGVKEMATALIRGLPPGSEAMADLFSDKAFLDLPSTPADKVDFSFFQHLRARGGTALYDTIVASEAYFSSHTRCPRRVLMLITDGGEDASRYSKDVVLRSMEWPGAPVVCAFVSPVPAASSSDDSRNMSGMKALAKAGGGVTFGPPDVAPNGEYYKIEVRLPKESGKLIVNAPAGYYAPAK